MSAFARLASDAKSSPEKTTELPARGTSLLTSPIVDPVFFPDAAAFRTWLAEHHEEDGPLWVGYYKKGTGRPSQTWEVSVDQALCYGWIDGLRRSIDDHSYAIRFTPRKPRSKWSRKNVDSVERLRREGLMQPAGLAAYARRDETAVYSYEQRHAAQLSEDELATFRSRPEAWEYFEAQAAWYRRTALHWVVSCKRAETRRRRLATLIEDSAAGRPIGPLARSQPR